MLTLVMDAAFRIAPPKGRVDFQTYKHVIIFSSLGPRQPFHTLAIVMLSKPRA